MEDEEWISDDDMKAMTGIGLAIGTGSAVYENRAHETFVTSLPEVAQEIVKLALYAANDRIRLDAGKYVIERILGRTPDHKPAAGGEASPVDQVMAAVLREPTAEERNRGMQIRREDLDK